SEHSWRSSSSSARRPAPGDLRMLKTVKRVGRAALVPSLVILAAGASHSAPTAPPDHGIALVELFTSEGCSSCPRADALLERLAADAATSGRPVYCLSFHVDYWDHLGWKDRFSSAAFTERQGEYAKRLGATSLYTPQMVVN